MKHMRYLKAAALSLGIAGALSFGAAGHAFARVAEDSSRPQAATPRPAHQPPSSPAR